MMYFIVILFFSFIISTKLDEHLYTVGPFGKRHVVNKTPNLDSCNSQTEIVSSTDIRINLHVTAVSYSSNEQINLTWTSSPTTCIDDFIGIYFTETSFSAGIVIYLSITYK